MIIKAQGEPILESAYENGLCGLYVAQLRFSSEQEIQRFTDTWVAYHDGVVQIGVEHYKNVLDPEKITVVEFPEYTGYYVYGVYWSKSTLYLTFANDTDSEAWRKCEIEMVAEK